MCRFGARVRLVELCGVAVGCAEVEQYGVARLDRAPIYFDVPRRYTGHGVESPADTQQLLDRCRQQIGFVKEALFEFGLLGE